MDTSQSFDRAILKVLNGVQSGAEVSLVPGEYTVGTGEEDDIQLIDVSIKSGQARLRIGAGTIEIAGGSGAVVLGSGETLPARSDYQEIEPLEVIELGMVRFVLGPPNANWTTLTEKPDEEKPVSRKRRKKSGGAPAWQTLGPNSREWVTGPLVLPVLLIAVIIGAGIWFLSDSERETTARQLTIEETKKLVRDTLNLYEFGKPVIVRVEADGTIYAEGFVKNNFERRALLQAIEREGVAVNFRLGVIEALNAEIEGLIRSEKLPITFEMAADGRLTLEGVVLDDKVATQFVDRIKESVISLASVTSNIKTALTILEDVRKLSKQTQIDSHVLFRLDDDLIEASGILPTSRIDGWEGFLQAYVRRYADHIGLRSFVQLQSPDGTLTPAPGGKIRPVVISGKKRSDDDIVLDAQRIAQGQYQTPEFFARVGDAETAQAALYRARAAAAAAVTASTRRSAGSQKPQFSVIDGKPLMTSRPPFKADTMAKEGNELVAKWKAGKISTEQAEGVAKLALARAELALALQDGAERIVFDAAKPADRVKIAKKYLPLFVINRTTGLVGACRLGSRLTPNNIPVALFWLDLLSVSESFSLSIFNREEQAFILEAALDPTMVKQCLKDGNIHLAGPSVYLTETQRNPQFVRFLTRQFGNYPMDVSGASLIDSRYVQMRNGEKVGEGGAPDSNSRLAIVGELGAAIQKKEGFWTVIYDPSLNWLSQE